VERGNLSI